jgi:hypothetical protein
VKPLIRKTLSFADAVAAYEYDSSSTAIPADSARFPLATLPADFFCNFIFAGGCGKAALGLRRVLR